MTRTPTPAPLTTRGASTAEWPARWSTPPSCSRRLRRRDAFHDAGLAILRGIDDGSLPEAVVLRFVLAETLNGLTAHAGHEAAVDVLDRLERTERVHVEALSASTFTTATARFRTSPSLSLVDACLVAHAERADHESLYAFDDEFDGVDEVVRLGTATNPYDPDP